MYIEHWGLKELPFENTPNPRFFFRSAEHEEALARLQYLLRERKSCGLLTGVYGCGKTLVLQALRKSQEAEGCRFSVVSTPRLDDLGMLRLILYGFGVAEPPAGKADALMALERLLVDGARDGKHSVAVVDEAHSIEDARVFEELRLLLNFQTETRFLLTLLLVGQPELKPLVEANKQLNQRIGMRFHLDAFSLEDTRAYLRHRLQIAGAGTRELFAPKALDAVHQHAGGIPRWINHYAHLSLLLANSKDARVVTPEIVEEAVRSLAGAA